MYIEMIYVEPDVYTNELHYQNDLAFFCKDWILLTVNEHLEHTFDVP